MQDDREQLNLLTGLLLRPIFAYHYAQDKAVRIFIDAETITSLTDDDLFLEIRFQPDAINTVVFHETELTYPVEGKTPVTVPYASIMGYTVDNRFQYTPPYLSLDPDKHEQMINKLRSLPKVDHKVNFDRVNNILQFPGGKQTKG